MGPVWIIGVKIDFCCNMNLDPANSLLVHILGKKSLIVTIGSLSRKQHQKWISHPQNP